MARDVKYLIMGSVVDAKKYAIANNLTQADYKLIGSASIVHGYINKTLVVLKYRYDLVDIIDYCRSHNIKIIKAIK